MTSETTTASRFSRPHDLPQPTAEQLARRQSRRRFNRLYVYLPLVLVALLWLGLILGMLWLSVAGRWFAMDTNQVYYRSLISGVADAFAIIMLMPLLLLCALPTAAFVGLFFYQRQRKKAKAQQGESLPILWRVENAVSSVRATTDRVTPKLADPVITAHATVAYVRIFLRRLKEIITEEINRYVNHR